MMMHFGKEIYNIWISERPTQLAAALAYYSIFSFAPIIFVTINIVELFIREKDPAGLFFQRLEVTFGSEISTMVQDSIMAFSKTPTSSSILISVLSFLALLYAASGLFFQLQFSLNTIWRVPPPQKGQTISFIRQRLFAFLIVIGFGLIWLIAVFANIVLAWFGSIMERLLGLGGSFLVAGRLVLPLLMFMIIALFYKILPDTKIAWRDVWLGSVLTTALILIAILLVGVFFRNSSLNSALQASGAFAVLLVSFYYVAQIFLLGAICCRVYADLYGSRRSPTI